MVKFWVDFEGKAIRISCWFTYEISESSITPRFWLGAKRVEPSFAVVGKETGLVLRVVAIQVRFWYV